MIKRDDVTTLLAILVLFFFSGPSYIIFTTAAMVYWLASPIVHNITEKSLYNKFNYLSPSKKKPDTIAKQFKKTFKNKKNWFSIFNNLIAIILLFISIYNVPLWYKAILLGLFGGAIVSIAIIISTYLDKM